MFFWDGKLLRFLVYPNYFTDKRENSSKLLDITRNYFLTVPTPSNISNKRATKFDPSVWLFFKFRF